jgi:lysyl-tRNA synthetase class I
VSMQRIMLAEVVHSDPWSLYCVECSETMRIKTLVPTQDGMEIRTYECPCGHRETLNVSWRPAIRW